MGSNPTSSVLKSLKQKIFSIVRKIKRGKTLTYKEVAKRAGRPKAYRAVGNILSTNYDPKIPCHRVVRSDLPAPRPGICFVYAILCDEGSIYIGQTQDLQKRWRKHVDGTASNHTKKHKPLRIIHYEKYSSIEKAIWRERGLKTGFGRKWLKREWKAGRTRQAGGKPGGYNRGVEKKHKLLKKEGTIV